MGNTEHNEFVKFMLKKANSNDSIPQPVKMLAPKGKDPETKPQDFTIREDDLKKAEDQWKKIKSQIK
ncbi:hypothetical protein FJZ53_03825 [Candidatus Woesearchaeota archaeon]|nr:hypothetical protein [Candidatus Woesearchaeota archaeon]